MVVAPVISVGHGEPAEAAAALRGGAVEERLLGQIARELRVARTRELATDEPHSARVEIRIPAVGRDGRRKRKPKLEGSNILVVGDRRVMR